MKVVVASMTEFKSIYFLTAGGHYCFKRVSKNWWSKKSLGIYCFAHFELVTQTVSLDIGTFCQHSSLGKDKNDKRRDWKNCKHLNHYFEVLMCIKTKDTKQKTRMIKEEIWRIANIRVFWQFCKLSTVIASLSSSCRKGFIPNRKKKQSKRQVYY